ncbi:MAG: hypothetical protein K0S71_2617 [Clostridia bacterium]|jgi:hypothetical protein|nr:hypothetical protein [Clostridia bacterium]
MEGYFLLKYFFLIIGFASTLITIWSDIRAYQRNEYDPIAFRLRKGYEWKPIIIVSYFGSLMPLWYFSFFAKSSVYLYAYIVYLLSSINLTKTILNFKCYHKVKRKRILIEIISCGALTVLAVIWGYQVLLV